jgi:hypothetical protein
MSIEACGLALNILRTSILTMIGKSSDLVLSHPPYHDLIPYSGSEWGRGGGPHPEDPSRCMSEAEFLDRRRSTPKAKGRIRTTTRRSVRPMGSSQGQCRLAVS